MNKRRLYPSLTVVIPVFNEEHTIGTILKTVANSELVNEIVIIDDCSTDNSKQVIKKTIGIISKEKTRLKTSVGYKEFGRRSQYGVARRDSTLPYSPNV